ncbi:MAG: sigma-70 family RNA polymerase sigma factor [Saprospiraceae bacterium]|nr:sigma-70 family RNA polymerase sigma factor [Saprospiraceae bacterium]
MPTVSDEEWMQRLGTGDFQCAAHLFEQYHVRLYNFFLRMGYEQTTSEDLAQTVFERMIRYRESFRNDASFKSWIFQIARNVSADHYKKNRLRISDFAEAENVVEEDAPISRQLEEAENVAALYKAMAELPEDQREILVLTRFQNLKYSEVAEILGMTESNAKVKAHRAIKQLRELYFKMEQL